MLGSVDYLFHTVRGQLGRVKWGKYRNKPYEHYYAESGLYIVRHIKTGAVHFVTASSPAKALAKVLDKEKENNDDSI